MPQTINDVAAAWTTWLNTRLPPALHASGPRMDDDNESENGDKANVYIRSDQAQGVPVMIGLISTSLAQEDDSAIISNDVLHEQLQILRTMGPLCCFVAYGDGRISFLWCEDGSGGRDANTQHLTTEPWHGKMLLDRDSRVNEICQALEAACAMNQGEIARASVFGQGSIVEFGRSKPHAVSGRASQ